jgi:hypothetical protein
MRRLRQLIPVFCLLTGYVSLGQDLPRFGVKHDLAELEKIGPAPDYSDLTYWISHPAKPDNADLVPGKGQLIDNQANAEVDVFFIYPTIYTREQSEEYPWFADVTNAKQNERIANSTIKYQATVFNGSARIYSPLYRQAHISVYYADTVFMEKALDIAYQDVKEAFEFYLENENNGRPVIIASHSQGTNHAARLLREFFEGKPLMGQLVAAYIIGMPVKKDYFTAIVPCTSPEQTGCWMTWNSYLMDYYPPRHQFYYSGALSVNPLTWTTDESLASHKLNKGGILKNFKKLHPGLTNAKNHQGMLWIDKPRFFGNFLLNWKRFHTVDYNLFYLNIRENVALRVEEYLNSQPE